MGTQTSAVVMSGSAGTSAPARITTPSTPSAAAGIRWQRRDFGPGKDHIHRDARLRTTIQAAAPGLRPRRGSQLEPGPEIADLHRQRRDFGPGEDHNAGSPAYSGDSRRQRRDFGPGEDHNFPSASANWTAGEQRRNLGPGEDHNQFEGLVDEEDKQAAPELRPRRGSQLDRRAAISDGRHSSAGASAPARITTSSSGTKPPWPPTAAPGLRPRRGSQHPADRPDHPGAGAALGLRSRRGSQHLLDDVVLEGPRIRPARNIGTDSHARSPASW